MRRIATLAAMLLLFAASPAGAERFESWTDGMCVAPGTQLCENVTDISEDTRCVGVVLDGALYSSTQNSFDFGKINAGRHCAYILSLGKDGTFRKSGHISFVAAANVSVNSEDYENYNKTTSKWKMNALATVSKPYQTDSAHGKAMRIKWSAKQSPVLMCQSISIPDTADVVAQAEIMITDAATQTDIFTTGMRANGSFDTDSAVIPAVLENGKIAGVDIGVDKWARLRYEFNVSERRYMLFVNDVLAAEGELGENFSYNELRFDVANTGSGYLYIDNTSVDYTDMSNTACVSYAAGYDTDGNAYHDMCSLPQNIENLRLTLSGGGNISGSAPVLLYNGVPMYDFNYSSPEKEQAIFVFPDGLKAGEYRLMIDNGRYEQSFCVADNAGVLYSDAKSLFTDIRGRTGIIYPGVFKPEGAVPVFGVYNSDGSLDAVALSGGVKVNDGQYIKVFLWDNRLKPVAPARTDISDGRMTVDASAAENFIQINDAVVETGTKYLADNTGFAEYFKNSICFIKDSGNFWFYGKKLRLEAVPECRDGRIYLSQADMISLVGAAPEENVPAGDYLAERTDMQVSENGYMLLLCRNGEYLNEKKSRALAVYLAMERPTADWLCANISDAHPRVYANAAQLEKIFSSENTQLKAVLNNAVSTADYSIGLIEDKSYETTDFSTPRHLWDYDYVLANYLAWRKTGNEKYKNTGIHMGDYTASFEHWSQNSSSLVTSAMIATASYAYDLFYDEMTDEQRDKIAAAIFENGIKPGYEYLLGNKTSINTWPIKTNNWNLVCASGVAVGAAALLRDYPQYDEICTAALEAAIRSLEHGMTSFMPDGGGEEGASYLDYEMYLGLIPFLECMDASYDTDFGFSQVPGFRESGYFMAYVNGAGGTDFRYHDYNPAAYWPQRYEMMWFASKYGDETLYKLAYGLSRNAPMISKPMALFEKKTNGVYENDKLFTRAGIAVATRDNAKLFMHAGDNNATHGQLDAGTFSYDFDGVRFACDAGGGDYDDRYFIAPEEYYVNRAEAHNVYVIDPDASGGQVRKATASVRKINGGEYGIDMTAAYADKACSAQRYFKLSEDGSLSVRDEIVPVDDCGIKWFWSTEATVTIVDAQTVRLYKNGKTRYLHFSSDAELKITSGAAASLDPSITKGASKISNLKKITVSFSAKAGEKVRLEVTADGNRQ